MTFFDGSDAEAAPAVERSSRPAWVKCLGTASAVAVVAFLLLAIGVFAGATMLTGIGLGIFCIAGLITAAGGYVYFFYERGE